MTQELIVYGIVVLAVAYLARTLWLSARGKQGCGCDSGGCGKMKTNASTQSPREGLVQVTLNFNGSSANGTRAARLTRNPDLQPQCSPF
jgi:hypothetical protein